MKEDEGGVVLFKGFPIVKEFAKGPLGLVTRVLLVQCDQIQQLHSY